MTSSIIQHLPDILTIAIFSSLLSLFLDFCFREGNIFEGWLEFWYEKSKPDKVLEQEMNMDRDERFANVKWFWFKPLGYCVVCSNVWVSFFLSVHLLDIWAVLSIIILSNFVVRFFYEKIL